jgi:hypothetical protein
MKPRLFPLLAASALAGLCLAACQADNTGPKPDPAGNGAAHLDELLFNSRWYRTYDSTNSIIPSEATLLFSWTYRDSTRHPDSFFVGIDTLWSLPQDVGGDTANDWDLQVCPDQICMNGLKAGIHGANAPYPFGSPQDTGFEREHHFQFFPAIVSDRFYAPTGTLFGGLMYVRSRSGSSPTDTVFGFGAWKTEWDTAYPPPVRPVNGYLPRRSDFVIVNGKIRYQGP